MKWSVLTKFIFRCGAGRDAQSRYYDHAVTHCDCMLFSGESRRGENVFQGNKHKVKGRQICKVLLSGLRGEREEGGGDWRGETCPYMGAVFLFLPQGDLSRRDAEPIYTKFVFRLYHQK